MFPTRVAAAALAAALLGLGAALPAPATRPHELARGECVVVTQVRDLVGAAGRDPQEVGAGSGGALLQALYNSLVRLGFIVRVSRFASSTSAIEEGRALGCPYLVRPGDVRLAPERINLALELIAVASGEVRSGCVRRRSGRGVAELIRPAVEECLVDLVSPGAGPAASGPARDRDSVVVVPYTEWSALQRDEPSPLERGAVEHVLGWLVARGHDVVRAAPGKSRAQLLARARKEQRSRLLVVGVPFGADRTRVAQASPEARAELIDATSGQALTVALVRPPRELAAGDAGRALEPALDCAASDFLDRPDDGADDPCRGLERTVLEPPVEISSVEPKYPRAAKRREVEGVVVVGFTVDERGRVGGIEVLESAPELDRAAIAAARRSRFTPGRQDGRVLALPVTARFEFTLRRR